MKFRTIEASPMEVYEAHVDLKKQAFTGGTEQAERDVKGRMGYYLEPCKKYFAEG